MMQRKTKIWLIFTVPILLLFMKVGYLIYYDNPYWGKVVEYETGKPIKGAVVHVEWTVMQPHLIQGEHHFLTFKETVTDEDGDFFIWPLLTMRLHPRSLVSWLHYGRLTVFKAGGYGAVDGYPCYRWHSPSEKRTKDSPLGCYELDFKWLVKGIFKLKRVEGREERLDNSGFMFEKGPLLEKEVKKEEFLLGLR